MNEGSLTYPGISVIVKRPVSITVEYFNKNGEIQHNKFEGLTARIFQHAFDHLQGTTMKERVSKLKWDMATKRLNNYKQKLVKKYTQKKLLEIKKAMEEQTNGNT
jgi:peptide deformylase